MMRRFLEPLLATGLGGYIGTALVGGEWATGIGAGVGVLGWILWDNTRVTRVLRWLDTGQVPKSPDVPHVWGEVVERARRGLRNMDRKARKSEARLEEFLAAIQASPNGVVLLDKNGTIEWCNFTAAQHLGFDPKRDIRQYIRNLVRDPLFSDYLKGGDFTQPIEIDGRQADPSRPHKISIQIHPYRKTRKLLLTRDVTALLLADAMRRDFVANVSHEIRTPLTVLIGFVETLIHLPLTEEERQRYLALMAQQADRMQTLVSDLLTLSRLEGSPIPGSTEWVSCTELLQQVVDEARGLSATLSGEKKHDIAIQSTIEARVAGARSELHSAISNLVSNAVRYTPAGGAIRVGWEPAPDGGIAFVVTDTGPGIEAEHLPRLFERFYRVDRSRSRETGGTGLGLAIAKHVAQRHGGSIHVESTPGQGSMFQISLPANRLLVGESDPG